MTYSYPQPRPTAAGKAASPSPPSADYSVRVLKRAVEKIVAFNEALKRGAEPGKPDHDEARKAYEAVVVITNPEQHYAAMQAFIQKFGQEVFDYEVSLHLRRFQRDRAEA